MIVLPGTVSSVVNSMGGSVGQGGGSVPQRWRPRRSARDLPRRGLNVRVLDRARLEEFAHVAPACFVVARRRRRRRECIRASRHREFRFQQGHRDQRHGVEARVRESALVAVRERRRRRTAAATEWQCEMRAATVLRRSGWSEAMFTAGTAVSVTGVPGSQRAEHLLSRHDHVRRRHEHGSLRPAAEDGRRGGRDRPERLPNGDPNLNGDWAGEQRVMTDRRGISGALVPISVADQLAPGAVPEGGRAFPGARGTPESLAENAIRAAWSRPSPVPLTEAGRAAAEGFDPSSADNPRLRCEPTNILFDWGFETFTNRITQDENVDSHPVRRARHRSHDSSERDRASGEHRAERRGPLDRPLGERRARSSTPSASSPACLSADTSTMHSDRAARRRAVLARSSSAMALRREYVADGSAVLHGRVPRCGHGVRRRLAVRAADLQRFELRDGPRHARGAVVGRRGTASRGRTPEPAPAKPWWMFWK